MSALGVLNLRMNKINGPVHDAFPGNCSLKTLDLNANFIKGEVPKSLEYCSQLEVLDLGNNNLFDKFPCLLKNISTLKVLVLRSNNFHGQIECPDTNRTWAKLQIIDLAHNRFSGELQAHSFEKWTAMTSGGDNPQPKLNHLQFQVLDQVYYQDSVTVTSKGLTTQLLKILTIYTSIDLSSNNFYGPIPEEIGGLTLLYVLNLSHNSFMGPIPPSFGELQHLESLDLSSNGLTGTIPTSLASLNFLSYLNLSFNQLMGRIPSGNQFQTFSADFFMGNEGLCGFPLTQNCTDGVETPNGDNSDSGPEIDWDFLSAEIGFVVGFGIVVGRLVLCKRWRRNYFEIMDDAAFWIFPLAVTRMWLSWTTTR